MTSLQEKIIKPKLGFLALARQLGSVSQACTVMGHCCPNRPGDSSHESSVTAGEHEPLVPR